jgi:acylglycerol lipase
MNRNQGIVRTDGSLSTADGLKLYFQYWKNPAIVPRACLAILHGLKDHSSRYSELATRLAGRGFSVYGLDLRGHGRSGGRKVYVRNFSEYVDDLDNFLAVVRKENPGVPLFLFGHSMGGTISTRLVMTETQDVRGLILSAAATQPGAEINPILIRIVKVLGALLPGLAIMNLPNGLFSRDPKVVAAMASDPLIYQKKGPARTAAQFLGAMQQIQRQPEKVSIAILILHGTADRLTNPAGSQRLEEMASSKDKTLKLYPGLYHDLIHEPEKEQVMADIINWLESHTPSLN